MSETMGSIIMRLRKEKGLTQEQLANELGISFQAVSKWENELSSPDISALPLLADLFGVSIDALFGRGGAAPVPAAPEREPAGGPELPWPDDDTLHAVLFEGRRLVGRQSSGDRIFSKTNVLFRYEGPALNVQSDFSVTVEGDVQGDVNAHGDVDCGEVGGSVYADGDVDCGDILGHVTAGGDVDCGGVEGNLSAGGDVDCDAVGGSVNAGGDVDCGDVGGSVNAGGDVDCGAVGGGVSAEGDVAAGEDFRSNLKGKKKGFSFELKL